MTDPVRGNTSNALVRWLHEEIRLEIRSSLITTSRYIVYLPVQRGLLDSLSPLPSAFQHAMLLYLCYTCALKPTEHEILPVHEEALHKHHVPVSRQDHV